MVYNTKKYLKELKTNSYWEVEPHFFYWILFKTLDNFKTVIKNKMSPEDFKSAMYGEFVIAGKPIEKGFIKNLNSTIRWLGSMIDSSSRENGKVSK